METGGCIEAIYEAFPFCPPDKPIPQDIPPLVAQKGNSETGAGRASGSVFPHPVQRPIHSCRVREGRAVVGATAQLSFPVRDGWYD